MLCKKRTRPFRRGQKRSGFSLVELIVVMVIIGMLASIVTLATRRYLISAKQTTARAEISKMVEAIDSFYAENGRYPTNEEGLDVLANPLDGSGDGYLKKVNKDPWKRDYEYNSPGRDNLAYEVLCLGGDGREGGEGEDKDITSYDE
ncbi:MAG: type II secretion system major pseudopilin GspG [Planctomycetaceae bacterium]